MKIKTTPNLVLFLRFSSVSKEINDENLKTATDLLANCEIEGLKEKALMAQSDEGPVFYINSRLQFHEETSDDRSLLCISAEDALINLPAVRMFHPEGKTIKQMLKEISRIRKGAAAIVFEFASQNRDGAFDKLSEFLVTAGSSGKDFLFTSIEQLAEVYIDNGKAHTPAESDTGKKIRRAYLGCLETPAHRAGRGGPVEKPASRTLIANMTGSVTLAGPPINLHFNRGTLKKISSEKGTILDNLNSRTGFKTRQAVISYRNESAFSFEDGFEYGLRTLQVPRDISFNSCRVITDFFFSEEHEGTVIMSTLDYPEFREGDVVHEAAFFETPLLEIGPQGIEIRPENNGEGTIKINREDEKGAMLIPGSSFRIETEDLSAYITFPAEFRGAALTPVRGLALKTAYHHREPCLYINPGGSYQSAPAALYSGLRERICFIFKVEPR